MVGFWLVATWGAGAACGGEFKVDGHGPGGAFEGYGVGDVFGLVGGVDVMAGFAGSAFVGAIDVDEVEVGLSVAEVGEAGGLWGEDELLAVALEAELVGIEFEGEVEGAREGLSEEAVVLAAMDLVASGAVA